MLEDATIATPAKTRTIRRTDPRPAPTQRMLNAGLSTLVSLGYLDASSSDAAEIHAAMSSAEEAPAVVEDEFAELRRALSLASRAPWRHDPDHPMAIGSRHALVRGRGRAAIVGIAGTGHDDGSANDTAFMAIARNQLPALLAAYDELKADAEGSATVDDPTIS